MKVYKVIHLHTDHKFTYSYKNFEGPFFINTTVLVSNKIRCNETKQNLFTFTNTHQDIETIIDLCNNADVVVIYNLSLLQSQVILKISRNTIILWRFFGVELYSRNYLKYISKKGIREGHTLVKQIKESLKGNRIINKTEKFLNSKDDYDLIFERAIQRVDYMLVLSKEEYLKLKSSWPNLPQFIKLPHNTINNDLFSISKKRKQIANKPLVIVGNSRSPFNNHLDIIDLIENHPSKYNYDFTLFFNYGGNKYYNQKVRERVKNRPYFNLIEEFLSKSQFNGYYDEATALVINSYRQLAGANITTALSTGVKVYLNDKNIYKKWLENEGFKVYSINDLKDDLKNDNITLDVKSVCHNINNMKKFASRYTKHDFQRYLYDKIRVL